MLKRSGHDARPSAEIRFFANDLFLTVFHSFKQTAIATLGYMFADCSRFVNCCFRSLIQTHTQIHFTCSLPHSRVLHSYFEFYSLFEFIFCFLNYCRSALFCPLECLGIRPLPFSITHGYTFPAFYFVHYPYFTKLCLFFFH